VPEGADKKKHHEKKTRQGATRGGLTENQALHEISNKQLEKH